MRSVSRTAISFAWRPTQVSCELCLVRPWSVFLTSTANVLSKASHSPCGIFCLPGRHPRHLLTSRITQNGISVHSLDRRLERGISPPPGRLFRTISTSFWPVFRRWASPSGVPRQRAPDHNLPVAQQWRPSGDGTIQAAYQRRCSPTGLLATNP